MKSLIAVVLMFVSGSAFAQTKVSPTKSAPTEVTAPVNEVHVGVKGMVCAFCAQGIEKKFKAEDAIESVQVSLEKKFVHLKFKPGKTLVKEKISQILKDAGYEADFGG